MLSLIPRDKCDRLVSKYVSDKHQKVGEFIDTPGWDVVWSHRRCGIGTRYQQWAFQELKTGLISHRRVIASKSPRNRFENCPSAGT